MRDESWSLERSATPILRDIWVLFAVNTLSVNPVSIMRLYRHVCPFTIPCLFTNFIHRVWSLRQLCFHGYSCWVLKEGFDVLEWDWIFNDSTASIIPF